MCSWLCLFLFFQPFLFTSAYGGEPATIIIRGTMTAAKTDDNFICATLDWWPPEKCNYNQCPWGQSSILNLDLNHPFLSKAIQAFLPLRIRIGGSLQDQVVYEVPNMAYPCLPFEKRADGLFGFSEGCLSMARWDELNLLFEKTGAIVTFGLNALCGRYRIQKGIWGGPWNSSNARSFIGYTVLKGYQVDSWEFGNELSGHGVVASVNAVEYGNDMIELKAIVDELYQKPILRPLVLAPGGFYEQHWYAQLLQVSGSDVVNVMTHHIYNLGAGNDLHLVDKILDPQYLSQIANTLRDLELTIQRHGPWASAWVSESGGAYNSGGRGVSDTFINSFWYLDQLGLAAKYNTKVYCRQALIGGNYGLLDTKTFLPNPDFYSALLWHRLMGKGVLGIDISGSSLLRAYAHCAKHRAGVTLLLINLSNNTEFSVTVRNDMNVFLAEGSGIQRDNAIMHGLKKTVSWVGRKTSEVDAKREEYHLTAKDGYHRSKTMLLNGNPLELTENGNIPDMDPILVSLSLPIGIMPLSIAFIVFPEFEARACV
uniref:Heparanase-like protein 1 n=1 Tax=Anthurium amnicola TaxID=1678845 RepID=A0A1D1Z3K1_9ARAE